MPYFDPEATENKVMVRLPNDPPPRRVSRDRADFEHREQPTDPDILSDHTESPYTPETELEALMMSAPGEEVRSAEDIDAEYPYLEAVQEAYWVAVKSLTPAESAGWLAAQGGVSAEAEAAELGITARAAYYRRARAAQRLAAELAWVIDPALKAKYRKPKPPAKPRPLAWTLTMQRIGALLAYSDKDDNARWQLARLLDTALSIGMAPSDLARRTGMVPHVLAQLVSDYRNG